MNKTPGGQNGQPAPQKQDVGGPGRPVVLLRGCAMPAQERRVRGVDPAQRERHGAGAEDAGSEGHEGSAREMYPRACGHLALLQQAG